MGFAHKRRNPRAPCGCGLGGTFKRLHMEMSAWAPFSWILQSVEDGIFGSIPSIDDEFKQWSRLSAATLSARIKTLDGSRAALEDSILWSTEPPKPGGAGVITSLLPLPASDVDQTYVCRNRFA